MCEKWEKCAAAVKKVSKQLINKIIMDKHFLGGALGFFPHLWLEWFHNRDVGALGSLSARVKHLPFLH